MRVLLTGASGFLGSHVLEMLRELECEVVAIGRKRPAKLPENATFIECDILKTHDLGAIIASAKATHCIHLAWYVAHGKFWDSLENLAWVEATVRLVHMFCAGSGKHVSVAGTCAEYDWAYGFCREDLTPARPGSLYGVCKDAARRLTASICAKYGVPCAWGRIFFAYGAEEDPRRLMPSLVSVCQGNIAPFPVFLDAYRDFLHISDVARGLVALMNGGHGVYNICSGQPVQIRNIVEQIANRTDADPQPILELAIERQGEPHVLFGDNAKLLSLGWRQQITLERGLHDIIWNTPRGS